MIGPIMIRAIEKVPTPARELAAYLLLAFVGWVDFSTGPDFSVQFFYLVPITVVAWFDGRGSGLVMGVVSAGVVLGVSFLEISVGRAAVSLPSWNAAVAGAIFVSFALALGTLRAVLKRLADLSRTDPLTEISNRRCFLDAAGNELARARRTGRPFALMYLDLDDFKHVNDTLGHQAGDALLRTIGAELRAAVRSTDAVARLGGDEFAVLLPETNGDGAADAAAKVRARLASCMSRGGWPVTFSIGVVSCATLPESVASVLETADRLMYSVKKAGKNGLAAQAF